MVDKIRKTGSVVGVGVLKGASPFSFYITDDEDVDSLFTTLMKMERDFSAKRFRGGWRVDFNCTDEERKEFTELGYLSI